MFEGDISRIQELGFNLRGTAILAEILPEPELKTASGLIIATDADQRKGNSVNAHKLDVAKVLAVGPGDYDTETKTYDPLDVKPGQVIIMNQYSYSAVSKLPGISKPLSNKLILVPTAGILATYPDMDTYEKALKGE